MPSGSPLNPVVMSYRRKLAAARTAHRREAERLAAALSAGGASKVILFGSVAQRRDSFSSDLDLVAISEAVRDVPFHIRTAQALSQLQPSIRTDLLIYTPEEWEELCATRHFVRNEISGKGVVLYERP